MAVGFPHTNIILASNRMSEIIDRLSKDQWIMFKCTEKYRLMNPSPVMIYNTIMGISAKITLKGLTRRDLRDTDYQNNESYQATEEGLFTRVTLMLQQYVCVERNLLG